MNVKDVAERLSLNVFSSPESLEREVTGGYASDLLSDVMGHAQEGQIWITLQTHKNIMAVASLKDLAAIILVKGFEPDKDTMELSSKEGIPVLGTKMQAFEVAGKLYEMIK
ncbi:MAG: DRTGG domain-containing protein [Bacteroidales bacterium]|jgi:predicted transcriptional regulator|nr:DRTGG domain-containing protein [Bacteroidales bacterium]